MAYEWEDPRRKWLQDMSPSVLERVSKQPTGKRRTWLARGDIKAAHQSRRQKLLDEANRPMQMRREFQQSQMPLGDREKMAATFGQQDRLAMLGQQGRSEAADTAFRRDMLMNQITNQQRTGAADVASQRSIDAAALSVQNRPPPQTTMGDLRVDRAGMLKPGSPEWQRTVGVTPEPEPQIPSVAEQEAKILSQFELGSPEWIQTRMQIEEIKRAPIDPVQQMLALQRLFRGTRETGPMGQLMQETMPGQEGVLDYARQGLNAMTGKVLNEQEVAALLQEANGDVNLARQIAEQRGWVIPQ